MSDDCVVVTSCTGTKVGLRVAVGSAGRRDLYTGQQHLRLMRGVRLPCAPERARPVALRSRILSALHGLLSPRRARSRLRPHLRRAAVGDDPRRATRDARARSDCGACCAQPFAARPAAARRGLSPGVRPRREDLDPRRPADRFCAPAAARRMPTIAGLRIVPLANAQARRFSCGLVALKGELGGRLLTRSPRAPSLGSRRADPRRATSSIGWTGAAAAASRRRSRC